jgi:type IV secretory pathway VirB6-like protein
MMRCSVISFIRTLLVLAAAVGCVAITSNRAMAQAAVDVPASAATSSAAILASQKGDFAKGATSAAQQINVLLGNVVNTAVDASSNVMSEANKFAWGLGVISLVLVGVRFAGTHHPIAAWVDLFEEVAILGIFVALYLGYTTSAAGFWTWFEQLAAHIATSDNGSVGSQMASLAGTIIDALTAKLKTVKLWDIPALFTDMIVLAVAGMLMVLASIIFVYYTAIGQIQAAIGIVLGPIAIALGFSSYTRSYFKKWLDWMISAGMYTVVVSVLIKLVGASITEAVAKATQVGGSTTVNGAYVFDLAVFVLLLSFEIPKLATIFGGGATATGTGAMKLASKFIP